MRTSLVAGTILAIVSWSASGAAVEPIAFATAAEERAQLSQIRIMIESLREFGGAFRDAAFRVYVPPSLLELEGARGEWRQLGAELRPFVVPPEVVWYPLASWPHAAAKAEEEVDGRAEVLAWLAPDTVFLAEPREMILPPGTALGYRPVFHRNISPLSSEPLDEPWQRAYDVMKVRSDAVFPMTTVADGDSIRPYFQAGCLVVRPSRGLLRKWLESFATLGGDRELRAMCERNGRWRTFAFQVALTGVVLNELSRSEMLLLSDSVNYPVFFKEMFGAEREFHDITGAVTIRYEHFFDDPPPDWDRQLTGPADRIAWLSGRFGKSRDGRSSAGITVP